MEFANPELAVLGIGLSTLPVVVHVLTRPRPVDMPFSAMRFLSEVEAHRRRRSRLRDAIVLALRTLALLAVAFAMGRPRLEATWRAIESEPVARVIVLDVSRSMAARASGVSGIERARALVRRELVSRPGLRAGVVLAGATAHAVFDDLSTNLAALVEEVRDARPQAQHLDAALALQAGLGLLAADRAPGRRELVVITDLQATSWTGVDLASLPHDARVTIQSVAPSQVPPNLAITSVRAREDGQSEGSLAVEVEVGNFSDLLRPVDVEVTVGGRSQRSRLELPPWQRRVVGLDAAVPEVGFATGDVRLCDAQDALPEDDRRSFVVQVSRPGTVGILTDLPARRPGTSPYFLARAWDPDERPARAGESADRASSGAVEWMVPSDVRPEVLEALDVIAVVRCRRLSDELVRQVAGLVARGRGLLVALEQPSDLENLRRLSKELGPDAQWMPAFASRAQGSRGVGHWRPVDERHAPFDRFGQAMAHRMTRERYVIPMASQAIPEDRVLARADDGTAALVAGRVGAGSVALVNVDLAASSITRSPLFVPLVHGLVRLLANRDAAPGEGLVPGKEFSLALPRRVTSVEGLEAVGEDGLPAPGLRFDERGAGPTVRGRVTRAGVYRIMRKGRPVHALSIDCPPGESDLRSLRPGELEERAGRSRLREERIQGSRDGSARDDDDRRIWALLIVVAMALLFCEKAVLAVLHS